MEWLRGVQLFVDVVRMGSLSAAARHSGVSPATVSRIIRNLEDDVGARLLNRTSRKLNLTEAGEMYFRSVEQILLQVQEANDQVAQLQTTPQGMLRVHSRMLVGNKYIVPALPEFMRRYPRIGIDLIMSNNVVDLTAQNIDVDIRIGALEDSSEIVRKLADAERIACATPGYLKNAPPLTEPSQLTQHNCLTYRLHLGRPVWNFIDSTGAMTKVPVSGSLQSDNGQALLMAMNEGLGIAVMPDWAVRDEIANGTLVRLFPDYRVSHIEFDNGIYAVFQQSRQVPNKVRVFIDYLATYFREQFPR